MNQTLHFELLLEHKELHGTKAKDVSTPGEKFGTCHDETELEKSKVALYRSCVMRLAYLSTDLPHLQFCVNRLARGMSKPTTGHWNRLKRAARHVNTHGRWVFADSHWASDETDRKSVSCVVTMLGEYCIRCQAATQSAPALSSGEEYVGSVKGASIDGTRLWR